MVDIYGLLTTGRTDLRPAQRRFAQPPASAPSTEPGRPAGLTDVIGAVRPTALIRATGLSQAQVPWQTSLAAFAFIRLLTALPITPGGLGITELGLAGTLAAGAATRSAPR